MEENKDNTESKVKPEQSETSSNLSENIPAKSNDENEPTEKLKTNHTDEPQLDKSSNTANIKKDNNTTTVSRAEFINQLVTGFQKIQQDLTKGIGNVSPDSSEQTTSTKNEQVYILHSGPSDTDSRPGSSDSTYLEVNPVTLTGSRPTTPLSKKVTEIWTGTTLENKESVFQGDVAEKSVEQEKIKDVSIGNFENSNSTSVRIEESVPSTSNSSKKVCTDVQPSTEIEVAAAVVAKKFLNDLFGTVAEFVAPKVDQQNVEVDHGTQEKNQSEDIDVSKSENLVSQEDSDTKGNKLMTYTITESNILVPPEQLIQNAHSADSVPEELKLIVGTSIDIRNDGTPAEESRNSESIPGKESRNSESVPGKESRNSELDPDESRNSESYPGEESRNSESDIKSASVVSVVQTGTSDKLIPSPGASTLDRMCDIAILSQDISNASLIEENPLFVTVEYITESSDVGNSANPKNTLLTESQIVERETVIQEIEFSHDVGSVAVDSKGGVLAFTKTGLADLLTNSVMLKEDDSFVTAATSLGGVSEVSENVKAILAAESDKLQSCQNNNKVDNNITTGDNSDLVKTDKPKTDDSEEASEITFKDEVSARTYNVENLNEQKTIAGTNLGNNEQLNVEITSENAYKKLEEHQIPNTMPEENATNTENKEELVDLQTLLSKILTTENVPKKPVVISAGPSDSEVELSAAPNTPYDTASKINMNEPETDAKAKCESPMHENSGTASKVPPRVPDRVKDLRADNRIPLTANSSQSNAKIPKERKSSVRINDTVTSLTRKVNAHIIEVEKLGRARSPNNKILTGKSVSAHRKINEPHRTAEVVSKHSSVRSALSKTSTKESDVAKKNPSSTSVKSKVNESRPETRRSNNSTFQFTAVARNKMILSDAERQARRLAYTPPCLRNASRDVQKPNIQERSSRKGIETNSSTTSKLQNAERKTVTFSSNLAQDSKDPHGSKVLRTGNVKQTHVTSKRVNTPYISNDTNTESASEPEVGPSSPDKAPPSLRVPSHIVHTTKSKSAINKITTSSEKAECNDTKGVTSKKTVSSEKDKYLQRTVPSNVDSKMSSKIEVSKSSKIKSEVSKSSNTKSKTKVTMSDNIPENMSGPLAETCKTETTKNSNSGRNLSKLSNSKLTEAPKNPEVPSSPDLLVTPECSTQIDVTENIAGNTETNTSVEKPKPDGDSDSQNENIFCCLVGAIHKAISGSNNLFNSKRTVLPKESKRSNGSLRSKPSSSNGMKTTGTQANQNDPFWGDFKTPDNDKKSN